MSGYYDRKGKAGPDGGIPLFATDLDNRLERGVAERLGEAWGCTLHKFGRLSPIDAYALRGGHLVGMIEIKNRSHPWGKYPTVFLNARKWLALMMAEAGMGCPAIFVVAFSCGRIGWTRAGAVAGCEVRMGGTKRIVKSHTDIEPCFLVPVDGLQELGPHPGRRAEEIPAPGEE